ncbi:acyl-CoA thioesterase [Rubellimicrobium aerolatum]|uniref:Acyl-CoA thioesterase n=1 Tax=Rubellimicrobium aerolatum TaxID=490979 RepID=A0ABW0SH09_9RHOB|nr:acyl-CoA thioesterase [Rubellimicrobium aerolatum]MBP1807562.1 acyl-CoA thioesterase FadM [Rubellimicrobium aerolatum]
MYPVVRLLFQSWRHRADPPLPLVGEHRSRHLCWPWDLDIFLELNNGRTLSLYDLGRVPWARRIGLTPALRREGWQVAVAGASVRWRKRVHAFQPIAMRTRALGWDHRFFYVEQSMWLPSGDCASHILIRSAVTDANGIVVPARVLAAMGQQDAAPPDPPPWARAWIEAESLRPWPPMPQA